MKEIELKLTLASEAMEAFRSDSLLGQISLKLTTEHLDNQYFDTPDLLLNKSHAALRIRKTPTHYVQTLKNKGQAIAGLHQRGEWESPLDVKDGEAPQLNWEALPEEARPDLEIQQRIEPLFKTDFERTAWIIQHNNSEIELVLDHGQISRGELYSPLCEVELELKAGEAADLFDFALQLAQRYPLVPCDVNKAERGYQLLNSQLSFYQPYQCNQETLDSSAYITDALSRISRRWDDFIHTRNWWLLVILQRQIRGLLMAMTALDFHQDLRDAWQQVCAQFDGIIAPATLPVGLFVDRNNNSRGLSQRLLQLLDGDMEGRLKALVDSNQLGQAMLKLGLYLYENQSTNYSAEPLLAKMQEQLAIIQNLDPNNLDDQLDCLPVLQAQAYLYNRIHHPCYEALNAYVDQLLIVSGMRRAEQMLPSLQDGDSRAKLASWTRRLTVELRALQDIHKPLQSC